MHYLSKLELDPRMPLAQHARLAQQGDYHDHQQLWKLFDDAKDRPFLYRRDEDGYRPRFYLLSSVEPHDADALWKLDCKRFAPQLEAGDQLAFSLRINPVVTTKDDNADNPKRRHRHDVVMDLLHKKYPDKPAREQNLRPHLVTQAGWQWLQSRQEGLGFQTEENAVHIDSYRQHRLFKGGAKKPIQFSTLDYNGVLTITNVDTFLKKLYEGIGPAKGFGCGMMMIRRV